MENELKAGIGLISQDMMNLLNVTWLAIPNWKWLALLTLAVLSFFLRFAFQYVLKKVKKLVFHEKPRTFLGYLLRLDIEIPLSWIVVAMLWLAAIDGLALSPGLDKYLSIFTRVILAINVIRLLYIAVDAMGSVFGDLARKTENTLDDQLVPFANKTLKVLVVVLGVLISLQNFGLNVMSLLAGLGLGGLALALAAQDTAANLFGSITILFDGPFKVGDWVKISDVEGNVEEIGFRSTRIRTFYNSLVTIPNATVAKEKIDNMGARPRRRVRQILGLLYETPPEKINVFCDTVRYMLTQEPKVDPSAIAVNFNNFNAASLDVQLVFHLVGIADALEEQQLTQKIFCEVLDIATKVGVEFAYPTQTLYLKNGVAPAEGKPAAGAGPSSNAPPAGSDRHPGAP